MPEGTTLLMLAFEFPPLGTVGVQRSAKVAKYLPAHGVTPVVVTTDRDSLDAWFGAARNEALLDDVPADVVVHRVPCPRPSASRHALGRRLRSACSLGEEIGPSWAPHVLRIWDQVVEQSKPAAVYVSIPPFSVAPLAVRLARRSGLPLILDFRDHWSQWCHRAHPTWLHYQATLRRERACVRSARSVVGVTGQLIRDLQRAHPQADTRKFHTIPNGYDGDLPAPRPPAASPQAPDTFVIGYAGSFYYSPEMRSSVLDSWWRKRPLHWLQYSPRREDWLYRSPHFFFQGLKTLFDARPELRSLVRVRFAGDPPAWLQAQIDRFGLHDVVQHLGRLSHRACLEFEARCDALLVTSAKVVGGRDYCIAGKTFEYLSAGRPILGIVTEGEQREFLLASGVAVIGDADDPSACARAIAQLVDGRFVPQPNSAFLGTFHRKETGRRVADLVRQVALETDQR